MSHVINMWKRHGSFSLPFQHPELLPLKNSSPTGGSNRRYSHKDPPLQRLPFTQSLFPRGNLLLLLPMKMLQRIKPLAATSHPGAVQHQTKWNFLKPTAGENPVTTVTASSIAWHLCVCFLYLRTPLPVWAKIFLPAQRISCTVEKIVEIFGMGLWLEKFFPQGLFTKYFSMKGWNSYFSSHWSWKRIRILTADAIHTAIWSRKCYTGLGYSWKMPSARSNTPQAKVTGFWLYMLCSALPPFILPLGVSWIPWARRSSTVQSNLLPRELVFMSFRFGQELS